MKGLVKRIQKSKIKWALESEKNNSKFKKIRK